MPALIASCASVVETGLKSNSENGICEGDLNVIDRDEVTRETLLLGVGW